MLPIIPALFAICGMSASFLIDSGMRKAGWLLPVILLACQWWAFPFSGPPNPSSELRRSYADIDSLVDLCERRNVSVLRGGFLNHWINFASEEKLTVCTYPDYDRFRPYRRAAFADRTPVVINNFMNFSASLTRTCGSAQAYQTSTFSLYANAQQTNGAKAYVPLQDIQCSLPMLIDGNISTPGILCDSNMDFIQSPVTLRVAFLNPLPLTGIRTVGYNGQRGRILNISIPATGGDEVLYHERIIDNWFWSGPRPYGAGPLNCAEYRFSTHEMQNLEITIPADARGQLQVTELLFITSEQPSPDYHHNLEKLIKTLEAMPLNMVYAPRWITEQINLRLPSAKTIISPLFYQQYDGLDRCKPRSIQLNNKGGGNVVVTETIDAPETRNTLLSAGFTFEEMDIADWCIFKLTDSPLHQQSRQVGWTEYGAFIMEANIDCVVTNIPDTATATDVRFANGVALEAFEIQTHLDNKVELHWYWRCPPDVDPFSLAVFTHFLPISDGDLFQDDRIFLPQIPEDWLREQSPPMIFLEKRIVHIPQGVSGDFNILIGIYDRTSGLRINLQSTLKASIRQVRLPVTLRNSRSSHMSSQPGL